MIRCPFYETMPVLMKSCPSHEAMPFSMRHCLFLWYSAWSLQKCTFLMKHCSFLWKHCSFLWNHAFCLIQWPTYKKYAYFYETIHISMKQCPPYATMPFIEAMPFPWKNTLCMKQWFFRWYSAWSIQQCPFYETTPFAMKPCFFYNRMLNL